VAAAAVAATAAAAATGARAVSFLFLFLRWADRSLANLPRARAPSTHTTTHSLKHTTHPIVTPGAPRGGYRGRGAGRAGARTANGGYRYEGEPGDMAFVRALRGHTRQVTAAAIEPGTGKLYTGSQDGTVRQWDVETGAPGPVVDVGGEVDSLLLEGGWLFVGLHAPPAAPGGPPGPGTIAAYNLASGAHARLAGHAGAVLCLAAAAGALFSGGQDATIRAWRWDESAATFTPAAVLDAASAGGHAAPVQALAPAGPWLVSGDWTGTLKVWDLAAGACAQTLLGAHASVVMAALAWEGHILSAGLDGAIKVWAPAPGAGSAPGAPVLEAAPLYTHPPPGEGGGGGRSSGGGGPPSSSGQQTFGGVLALTGAADLDGKAVAFASHTDDACVRLWELPSFAERGCLGGVLDARALAASPGGPGGGFVAVGDKKGLVKLWRWQRGGTA
jgi:WD40 repeat protein